MGLLVDGIWHDQWYDTSSTGGRFKRSNAQFRNWITPDGTAGLTGNVGFKAEAGRYHLYVSNACPWAHRTLITRALRRLEDAIGVTNVDPRMLQDGWTFGGEGDEEPLYGLPFLRDIYLRVDPKYTGRVTVPVLWDKKTETIVNNESREIM